MTPVTPITPQEKARATADKIRKDVGEEKKTYAIESITANAELTKLYNENAEIGATNLAGELPLLKVHAVGKSNTNELAEGGEPNDGYFFYKPTQEQFKDIECHILTISRGFRAVGLTRPGEEEKTIFNQIMGGVIVQGKDLKPFIMYMTGLKLPKLWEFGKEASKYTKAKPVSIPMFALTIKLTTEKVNNSFGKSWIINFDIEKNEKGSPIVVTDIGLFQFLRDNVDSIEQTIEQIIASKSKDEEAPVQVESIDVPDEAEEPKKEGEAIPF